MSEIKVIVDLSAVRALELWPDVLEKHVGQAMTFSLSSLQSDARANAPYLSGDLSESIDQDMPSPWQGSVYTLSPYGWRQEEGYSGLTDSLGRYFPNYPGRHYMRKALSSNKTMIWTTFSSEVQAAINEVTSNGSASGVMGWITGA